MRGYGWDRWVGKNLHHLAKRLRNLSHPIFTQSPDNFKMFCHNYPLEQEEGWPSGLRRRFANPIEHPQEPTEIPPSPYPSIIDMFLHTIFWVI